MNTAAWSDRTKEYRGCDITAASIRLESGTWIPEASFSLSMGSGRRRLWVNSFAHCFSAQKTTYSSKIEADSCALRMARALIDKALPEFEMPASIKLNSSYNCLAALKDVARRPLSALKRIVDGQWRQ